MLLSKVKEVETFAQFGSIFLLFGHGLTYSSFMNTGRPSSNAYAPQVPGAARQSFLSLSLVFFLGLACAS